MKRPRFTAVPHEVIDVHLRHLSESQIKTLLVILRKTYGWSREVEAISFSQISELTGMSRGSCSDAVKVLESLNLVKASRHSTEAKGLSSTTYEPLFEDDPPIRPAEQYKEERKESNIKDSLNTQKGPLIEPETFLHRWAQHRGFRKPAKPERERALQKWEFIEMDEQELAAALDGYYESEWAKREGYPILGFVKDPHSWIAADSEAPVSVEDVQVQTNSDAAPGSALATLAPKQARFQSLVGIWIAGGKPTGQSDIDDAWPLWLPMTEEQEGKSLREGLRVCSNSEPKFIPSLKNFLARKPWTVVAAERSLPAPAQTMSKGDQVRALARARGLM